MVATAFVERLSHTLTSHLHSNHSHSSEEEENPEKKYATKENFHEFEENFLKDISHHNEEEWTLVSERENFRLWKKLINECGIYRLKFDGIIEHPTDIVEKALCDTQERLKWDKVLENIVEIEDDGVYKILHIEAKAPPPVSNRDFVHIRTIKEIDEDHNLMILDVSTKTDAVPEQEKYVRAHTYYCGSLLKPLENGTKTNYISITQVDMAGSVPKSIVNMVSTKATLDWYDDLLDACDKMDHKETHHGTHKKKKDKKEKKEKKKEKKEKKEKEKKEKHEKKHSLHKRHPTL